MQPHAASAGDYDYIIVGAGSAGCLLANRLSADPRKPYCITDSAQAVSPIPPPFQGEVWEQVA